VEGLSFACRTGTNLVGIEQAFVVKSQAFVRQLLQYSIKAFLGNPAIKTGDRAPDRGLNLFIIAMPFWQL
jgi:hypothetical protein